MREIDVEHVLRKLSQIQNDESGEYGQVIAFMMFRLATRTPKRIIYITKAVKCFDAVIDDEVRNEDSTIFIRSGLYASSYFDLMVSVASSHGIPIFFIGDLDPLDVTTYLHLKSRAGKATTVKFIGLSDDWFKWSDKDLQNVAIKLYPEELYNLQLIDSPQVQELIGPRSYSMWQRGFKIALEGYNVLNNGSTEASEYLWRRIQSE